MRARLVCVLLLCNSAAVAAQTRPLDLLPGEDWIRARRPGIRFASGQPLAGMEPLEHWVDLSFDGVAHTSARARARLLNAGMVREEEVGLALHCRASWLEWNAGMTARRIHVASLGAQRRLRGSCALILAHGAWRGGVRVSPRGFYGPDRVLWEQHLRFRLQAARFALHRRPSAYADRSLWSLGVSLRLHPRFGLAVRMRGTEMLLQLVARASEVALLLGLPLLSPHGGGMAVGIGWHP